MLGAWFVEVVDGIVKVRGGSGDVIVVGSDSEESRSLAHLIAASPKMYLALLDCLHMLRTSEGVGSDTLDRLSKVIEQAQGLGA